VYHIFVSVVLHSKEKFQRVRRFGLVNIFERKILILRSLVELSENQSFKHRSHEVFFTKH
jgi:hypothetical protein